MINTWNPLTSFTHTGAALSNAATVADLLLSSENNRRPALTARIFAVTPAVSPSTIEKTSGVKKAAQLK
ncbi:MAG: hypothetical protein IIC79_06945 [Chloroflexi bacterium]|nr:hypothetical protein [Chloroflexota bacterium]